MQQLTVISGNPMLATAAPPRFSNGDSTPPGSRRSRGAVYNHNYSRFRAALKVWFELHAVVVIFAGTGKVAPQDAAFGGPWRAGIPYETKMGVGSSGGPYIDSSSP